MWGTCEKGNDPRLGIIRNGIKNKSTNAFLQLCDTFVPEVFWTILIFALWKGIEGGGGSREDNNQKRSGDLNAFSMEAVSLRNKNSVLVVNI